MNRRLKILLWGSNIWIFADGMLGPLFAVFTERLGGNVLDITWAWALYLGVTGLGVIIIGKFSDGKRAAKEKLLITGYALTAVFTFGYLFVSTTFHLLLVQTGLGIALALANPTWYALYDQNTPSRGDGYLWGLADGQGKLFTAAAILLGGFIVQYFSFTVLFIVMGIMQAAAALYLSKLLKIR